MGNTRNTGYLQNTIKVADNGNISLMHGSTMLMQISSSGAITTTGVISGSNALSASFAATASTAASAVTASFVALAQSASNAVSAQTSSFANALTVAGTLTAQTLVVQTITSSVDFVTGSTRFGSILGNTHVFSGSVSMNPGGLFVSSSGNVGIGTNSPTGTYGKLSVAGGISILDDNNAKLEIGRYSSGAPNSYIKIGTNSNSLRITNAADSTDLFTISGSGNVGIGNTNPRSVLSLPNTTGDKIDFYNDGSARYTVQVNSGELRFYTTGTDIISLYAGSTVGLVNKNGNIGIGLTNPQFKYHQSGGKFILNSSDGSYGQMQIGNTTSGGEATIVFIGGAASFGSVATSGDGNGAVWAIGSSVYGNGVTKFGIANVAYGNNIITVTSDGKVGIGNNTPTATKISLGQGIGAKFMVYDNPATGVYAGIGQDLAAGNSTDLFAHSVSNLGFLTFGKLGTNGSTYTEWARFTPSGDFYIGGTSMANGQTFGIIGSGVWDGANIGLQNTGTGGINYTIFSTNSSFGQGAGNLLFYNVPDGRNNLILYANGNYDFAGSDVSDIRLKQDIENINHGLNEIMQLSPKSYHLKSEDNLQGEHQTTLRKRYGFIAQEVQPILPDAITGEETETEYLGLDYNGVLAVAVKAIQELKAENDTLKEILQRNNIQ